jgi:hypothetical protein
MSVVVLPLAAIAYALSLYVHTELAREAFAFFEGASFWPITYLSAFVLSYVEATAIRKVVACGPDSLLVGRCLYFLNALQREKREWHRLPWRRDMSLRLESLAEIVEGCGKQAARAGDPDSAVWIMGSYRGLATNIRAKKKWLMVPKSDTQPQLVSWAALFLYRLGIADWDAMDRDEPQSLNAVERTKILVKRIAGLAASVAVPVVLFLLVQRSPTPISSPVKDYVVALLWLWALVAILSAIDPLYEKRFESFRSAVQIFPFMRKETEGKSTEK